MAKRICKDKKRQKIRKRLVDISKQYAGLNVREFYEKIRQERTSFQPRLHNIRSESGEMLTESEEIKDSLF